MTMHYETTLPKEAIPTEWNQLAASRLEAEIQIHRYMNCRHYAKCLSYASGLYWSGWSCHWCPLAIDYQEDVKRETRNKAREEIKKL